MVFLSCALFIYPLVLMRAWVGTQCCDSISTSGQYVPMYHRIVKEACVQMFVPASPTCPRFLINTISAGSGLGHQFTELLFGLQKAHSHSLSYIYEPFKASGKHNDTYTFVNDLLGMPRLFSRLGAASRQRAEAIVVQANASWSELGAQPFHAGCNVFRSVGGYFHCPSNLTTGNCFFAPESEYLYQNAAACLRMTVVTHGTAFDRCIFNDDEFIRARSNTGGKIVSLPQALHLRLLPRDTVIVVWHVRVGDVVLHAPGDPFYARVLVTLRQITRRYKLHVVLVGKGAGGGSDDGKHSVPQAYVDYVSRSIASVWAGTHLGDCAPTLAAPKLSLRDAFVAMMQADVLIGSGSSLPAVAALVSGEPLFLNHVAKTGYKYGLEMLADSVDLESNGTVVDSLRRLKVAVHKRMRPENRRACRFAG